MAGLLWMMGLTADSKVNTPMMRVVVGDSSSGLEIQCNFFLLKLREDSSFHRRE